MGQQAMSAPRDGIPGRLAEIAAEEAQHRRLVRVGLLAAAAIHLGLLAVPVPSAEVRPDERKREYHPVVPLPPLRPPEVRPEARPRRVPIPVPDVFLPEPVRTEPVAEVPILEELLELIPVAPAPPPPPEPAGPYIVGGEISEPRRIHYVEPAYPRAARLAKLEAVVVVRATLDRAGQVRQVEVLRGAPMGLSEAACEAVRQWRYEPARLGGHPVEVYLMVTVRFTLR